MLYVDGLGNGMSDLRTESMCTRGGGHVFGKKKVKLTKGCETDRGRRGDVR